MKNIIDYTKTIIIVLAFIINISALIFSAGKITQSISQNTLAIQQNTSMIQKNSADIVSLKESRAGTETELKNLKESNEKEHNLIIDLLDKTDKKLDRVLEGK